VPLWSAYTVLFVLLALLIPCLWVSYIWDQIIDPHYESDSIAVPDHRLLRLFYMASKKITGRFFLRTPIFIVVALLFVFLGVLDIVRIDTFLCIRKLNWRLLHHFVTVAGYHHV
jgi:hypothetical protein